MSALYRVITRTYLEMRQRSEFSPVQNGDARIRIEKIGNCPTSFFRYLYREVGRSAEPSCWIAELTTLQLRSALPIFAITVPYLPTRSSHNIRGETPSALIAR